jgi:hypothetical protein
MKCGRSNHDHIETIISFDLARRLVAPSALLRPQLVNTPSLIFLRIRRLKLLQQLLERIIIAVKPGSQLSELTLGCLLNGFHLTYLLLIKKTPFTSD